ncbi:BCLAF1 and THRAP3 family member 3 [Triplophysa rosa]|uniref:BCLAF1 and THRAP3 family member 3 n=1 Tax=Triplophysa rosa TaxID=992332 RepID=UPI002545FD41|nr:BCLAF1 and THRAP3 family member 3 [Triplophysa rosa]
MSRPRSRSPVYSRIPTLHGRRADGFFGGQIHSSVAADAWRNTEYDNRAESNTQWNKDSFQGDQHVDHWAKFIDAIEHAQQREALPMSTSHMPGNEERPPSSPRRLPRERLPSPDHARFDMEERYRMSGTPDWNRSEESDKHLGRHEHSLQQNQRESRDRSHPGHSEARRYDRTEFEFCDEEHGNQFHERGSFSERSSKSDFREHQLSSQSFTHLGQQNEYSEDHRGLSQRRPPVIVEHDHGISKRQPRNQVRDPPRTNDRPRSRDPPRRNEAQRKREPQRDRRDQGHHAHTLQGRHSKALNSNVREDSRRHFASYVGESQVRDRSRHMDHTRTESHSRDLDGRRETEEDGINDIDLRTERSRRERDRDWDAEEFRGNNRRMMEQAEVPQRAPYQRNPNTKGGHVSRMDFGEQETLKIKVDMSRHVGNSSYSGYSSDRQISLDLVNVGRQRLDFLPMLEHSGTYRESAVHSGTFAQEIITLVHQVKENYFKGQGITLSERFASEQFYSLQNEFKDEEDEEMESLRPVMNRQLGGPLSETQIFCKIGAEPPQTQQLVPDPGDLRYDLERRRQQRLEGVKITIAGGSFTQIAPKSQGSERPYANENLDRSEGNFGWSVQQPERQRQWNGPRQRAPAPNRQNFNQRGNFNRNNRAGDRRT